jgi:hypothetical protein
MGWRLANRGPVLVVVRHSCGVCGYVVLFQTKKSIRSGQDAIAWLSTVGKSGREGCCGTRGEPEVNLAFASAHTVGYATLKVDCLSDRLRGYAVSFTLLLAFDFTW